MSQHQHDPVLATAFTQARTLEPTDAEIASVVERVDRRETWVGAWGRSVARMGVRGALSVCGAAVAVAVAALAIGIVGHTRPQPAPTGRAPAAAQKLVSMLAVLRRPQTAADRTLPATLVLSLASRAGGRRTIVPGLTRLVATVPHPAGRLEGRSSPRLLVYMIVAAPTTAPEAGIGRRVYPGDLVSIAWVTAAGGPAASGVSRGVPAALLHGIRRCNCSRPTRVTTSASSPTASPASGGASSMERPTQPSSTTSRWHPPRSTNVGNGAQTIAVHKPKYLAGVTWYDSHGEVISSFHTGTANPFAAWKLVAQIHLRPATPTPTKPTGVLDVYKDGTRSRDHGDSGRPHPQHAPQRVRDLALHVTVP